jgi:hypothetical protein
MEQEEVMIHITRNIIDGITVLQAKIIEKKSDTDDGLV